MLVPRSAVRIGETRRDKGGDPRPRTGGCRCLGPRGAFQVAAASTGQIPRHVCGLSEDINRPSRSRDGSSAGVYTTTRVSGAMGVSCVPARLSSPTSALRIRLIRRAGETTSRRLQRRSPGVRRRRPGGSPTSKGSGARVDCAGRRPVRRFDSRCSRSRGHVGAPWEFLPAPGAKVRCRENPIRRRRGQGKIARVEDRSADAVWDELCFSARKFMAMADRRTVRGRACRGRRASRTRSPSSDRSTAAPRRPKVDVDPERPRIACVSDVFQACHTVRDRDRGQLPGLNPVTGGQRVPGSPSASAGAGVPVTSVARRDARHACLTGRRRPGSSQT